MLMIMLLAFCINGSGIMKLETTQVTVKLKEVASTPQQQSIQVNYLEYTMNYIPSEEEREFAYKLAFGEAGLEDAMGQTLVINTAINNMRERGFSNLIEEFTAPKRYSCVINREVYIPYGTGKRLVTEADLTPELKDAVEEAFRKDYTEELLKNEAESKGLNDPKYYEGGALYFYNPKAVSEEQAKARENIEVKFQHKNHTFYRNW